jgi:hypothetical protein
MYGVVNNNELYHHGVLGMKWGVRRYQNYDGSLKAAGKEHNKEAKDRKGLTDGQKKAIKIGAAITAACLVAAGTYYVSQHTDIGIIGKQQVTRLLNRNKGSGNLLGDIGKLSSETGFSINTTPVSVIQSTKKVNPGYLSGAVEYKNNCFSATTADVLNRLNDGRGLNCIARPATTEELRRGGMSFNDLAKTFKNSSIDDIVVSKSSMATGASVKENLCNSIKSFSKTENGVGIIRVKSAQNSASGHFIKWEIKNGDVFLSDSLSGTIGADAYMNRIASGHISRGIEIMQCDTCEIDPAYLKKIVSA